MKTNPAVGLYERLGMRIDGDLGTHFSMILPPKNTSEVCD
jgi:hypothetical protein